MPPNIECIRFDQTAQNRGITDLEIASTSPRRRDSESVCPLARLERNYLLPEVECAWAYTLMNIGTE
jgi:hypothetical protein